MSKVEKIDSLSYWFVGAMWSDNDETARFVANDIWENGYGDMIVEDVKSIKVGDKIAIKSSLKQKDNLPFNNNGFYVPCMHIKAVGTVVENHNDGKKLDINWDKSFKQKTWYFTAYRSTIVKVDPDNGPWCKGLIDLSFNDKAQDINSFTNSPLLIERFGEGSNRYQWTKFNEDVTDKLLLYKNKRKELLEEIYLIGNSVDGVPSFMEKLLDDSSTPLKDISPFTIMGIFNRCIADKNKINIATKLAKFLEVTEPLPTNFDGAPESSWNLGNDENRKQDDIDNLWNVFERAIALADNSDKNGDEALQFSEAYKQAVDRHDVGLINLSIGLYLIRPWQFAPLDTNSQDYIKEKLGMDLELDGSKKYCNGDDYSSLTMQFYIKFKGDDFQVHSFPELSHKAYLYSNEKK